MKRFAALLTCVGIGAILTHASFAAPLNYEDYPIIKLRSLDKITARTMNFEAKVGSTIRFGDIFIKVQACRKPPPVEKNEAAAFLQIYQANQPAPDETKDDAKSSWIFSGWMFASSPAISAMDHPIYDVWVLDCLGRDPEPLPPPEQQAAEAESKEGASETTENKEQNAAGTDDKTAPNDAAPSQENMQPDANESAPSEPKTDAPQPVTTNKEPAPSSQDSSADEPSVDEMLQPQKATNETGTQSDDNFIYSPPKPAPQPSEQNDAPLTQPNIAPNDSTPPESPPPQNSSPNLDGIY